MRFTRLAGVCTFLAFALLTLGAAQQQDAEVTVQRAADGDYLIDAEGMSVYIYLRDGQNNSTCYDVCVDNWPPVLVDGAPVAGDGVIASMLGTIERDDGGQQLTYYGWPLYYHARDREPGDTIGHRLGNTFYLMSGSGARVDVDIDTLRAAQAPVTAGEDAQAQANGDSEEASPELAQGAELYAANCAVCHGPEGAGAVGPGLAGNPAVGRGDHLINTVLFGRPDHGMPAFADQLSDEEIAHIATFVRNSWSNDFGAVTAEEVEANR